jgi:hypothetical protein
MRQFVDVSRLNFRSEPRVTATSRIGSVSILGWEENMSIRFLDS